MVHASLLKMGMTTTNSFKILLGVENAVLVCLYTSPGNNVHSCQFHKPLYRLLLLVTLLTQYMG